MTTKTERARAYIARIRNPEKQAYARAYLRYLCRLQAEPTRPDGLSYMAAQAVRMNIDQLMGAGPSENS